MFQLFQLHSYSARLREQVVPHPGIVVLCWTVTTVHLHRPGRYRKLWTPMTRGASTEDQ
jgi:hypothetical protein